MSELLPETDAGILSRMSRDSFYRQYGRRDMLALKSQLNDAIEQDLTVEQYIPITIQIWALV